MQCYLSLNRRMEAATSLPAYCNMDHEVRLTGSTRQWHHDSQGRDGSSQDPTLSGTNSRAPVGSPSEACEIRPAGQQASAVFSSGHEG